MHRNSKSCSAATSQAPEKENLSAPKDCPPTHHVNSRTEQRFESQLPDSEHSVSNWECPNRDYSSSLKERTQNYALDPLCVASQQPYVSSSMRRILLDWALEVCSEFCLKRETFYLTASHIDRSLSCIPEIPKENFQLIGLAAMCIAAKTEEIYTPKIKDWAYSADNGYSCKEIKQMERFLLRKLNWNIFPVTTYNWATWLMTQWDDFVEFHFGCVAYNNTRDFEHLPRPQRDSGLKAYYKRFIVFKHANPKAYKRFRETMAVLDAAQLDAAVLGFSCEHLAVSALYLMVNKFFFESEYCLLYFDGEGKLDGGLGCDEEAKYENAGIVQDLFIDFAGSALELKDIEEVHSSVEFLHGFLDLPVDYALPYVCKIKDRRKLEKHYEDFLAYQTYTSSALEYVTEKTVY